MAGKFVLSFDLELYWGVAESIPFQDYKYNVEKVHEVAPQLLDIMSKFNVQATWAAVGFTMARDLDELLSYLPSVRPAYTRDGINNYMLLKWPELKTNPKAFFAEDLMRKILSYKGQELGSHSFSHYYCQEPGQNVEHFRHDLKAAQKMAEKFKHKLLSYVFPRNHFNGDYLQTLHEEGFLAYRGNPQSYCYRPENEKAPAKRILRLLDRHMPIVNNLIHNTVPGEVPLNVPASLFIAPIKSTRNIWSNLRLNRILNLMSEAAKSNGMVHFWCHPHNLSKQSELNLQNMTAIFEHYKMLNEKYGMQSLSMNSVRNAEALKASA